MQRLTVPTGGRALFSDSVDELHLAFADLLDELSNQYLLGYAPTNATRDGAWRKIKVEVDGHHEVRARQGSGLKPDVMAISQPRETRRRRKIFRAVSRAAVPSSLSAQQPPRFQSSVEVTTIDVTVVDDRGKPMPNLTPADFNVRIDGNRRGWSGPSGCRSAPAEGAGRRRRPATARMRARRAAA